MMPTNRPSLRKKESESGVALLETLISILMLALGVLALIGLQANMNANTTEAKYRAEAAYLANQLMGQMWVDQANLAKYAISAGNCSQTYSGCSNWLGLVGRELPGGSAVVVIDGVSVSITVTWQKPGSTAPRNYLLIGNVLS